MVVDILCTRERKIAAEHEVIVVAGREVSISNPHKVLFPEAGHTKLDLVRYYIARWPNPVRANDLDHPDELRVDLDPVPGIEWTQLQQVASVVRATLDAFALTGWPKTSGSRGIHVLVRIEQRWTFVEVRRAALALAREVERRAPALATSKWSKEERHGGLMLVSRHRSRGTKSLSAVPPISR